MTGFEGRGDFDSADPWERYAAHQAAKGRSYVTADYADDRRKRLKQDGHAQEPREMDNEEERRDA
jgi:hypothetical protein